MRHVVLLFLTFIFTISISAAGAPPAGKAKPSPEDVMGEILSLNEQDLSCTKTEECMSVAVGARACGGPSGYIIVSQKNKNYSKIVERAKVHEALSKEQLKLNDGGMMGTCNVIMPTSAVCVKNLCQEVPQ